MMKPWRRKESGILPVIDDTELLDIQDASLPGGADLIGLVHGGFCFPCRLAVLGWYALQAHPCTWHKRNPTSYPTIRYSSPSNFIPCQEEIVQSLEASNSRQSFTWRVVFATLTSLFSAFFLMSAFWQAISPWELKYHAYFMDNMNSGIVVVAVVYASMAWGLLSSKSIHNRSLWISFGAGVGLAVFWLFYMQSLSRLRWDLFWLPLGPCGCAALCLYVEHLIVEMERDVGKLRTAMYHFKRS